MVAFLKAKPDAYNYASSGNGTILHLAAAVFVDEAAVPVKHIPYKGVGPMLADLMGGQVELGVLALPSIQGQLKGGTLRAIGVMSAKRGDSVMGASGYRIDRASIEPYERKKAEKAPEK